MTGHKDAIADYLRRSVQALERVAGDPGLVATLAAMVEALTRALGAGGKVLIAGNGGSAADAQHIAAELLSRFARERHPLPAIALTDPAVLTGIGNDYGFEHTFARQVRGLGRRGDVLLALSTSGRSPNVLAALKAAREAGLTTIGFTGTRGNALAELCDLSMVAPSDETAVIQQLYMTAAHAICAAVEDELGGPATRAK